MKLNYQMAVDLANRLIEASVVQKIWDRDPAAWHAGPGSADAKSIENRLGWLDVGRTMADQLFRGKKVPVVGNFF